MPLNPYMLAAVAVAAGLLLFGRPKPKPAEDSGDQADPYVYGHAPIDGGGGGGGMPTDLRALEGQVQNAYDGTGYGYDYTDQGGGDPQTTIDTSPGGTQDPSLAPLGGVQQTGIRALGGGLGIGGVAQESPAVQQAIAQQTYGASSSTTSSAPSYIPYTPPGALYVPGTSSAGGGGSTRI